MVTTRFVREVESAAGFAPFRAVRSDSSTSNPKLREQMRQLMTKGPLNLISVNGQSGSDITQ